MSYLEKLPLCPLSALCVFAVELPRKRKFTAEAQRTLRRRRELKLGHPPAIYNVDPQTSSVLVYASMQ